MKRKGADFLQFFASQQVTGRQTVVLRSDGWLVDFQIETAPNSVYECVCGQQKPSMVAGFRWLYWVPKEGHHTFLVFLNGAGQPEWFYADVIAKAGIDEAGIPWTDDLYLDVVALCEVLPDGRWRTIEAEIIDQDDLEWALKTGKITPEQHAFAWAEANAVQHALEAQAFAPLDVVRAYLTG